MPPVKLAVTFVSEIPEVALPDEMVEPSVTDPPVPLRLTAAALVAVTDASLTETPVCGRRCR